MRVCVVVAVVVHLHRSAQLSMFNMEKHVCVFVCCSFALFRASEHV